MEANLFLVQRPPQGGPAPLVGIAKLAASSQPLGSKRAVEYFSLRSKSILNRCASDRVPFQWTINPYRGCEFGCKYCYARYTHEYLGMENARQFEEKIYSKEHAAELLKRELGRAPRGAIAIGTATDPYQPAEREFQTTRQILETIAQFRGLQVSITTKSDLVLRDLDLLAEIGRRNDFQVNMTVTTLNARLARLLESRAPRPDLRIDAAARIARAGVPVAIFAMPVLPEITDSRKNLDAVAKAASGAGASHFAVQALFLMPSAQAAFFPLLQQEFPELVERYRALFARGAYLSAQYRSRIETLASELRRKYRLTGRLRNYSPEEFAPTAQMPLF